MRSNWVGAFSSLVLLATMLAAQTPSPTPSSQQSTSPQKSAEQVYRDIQVFKGVPADQIIPSMQFMNFALGVECEHCHLPGAYESPNANKTFARAMIRMQNDLTNGIFDNVRKVTCWTCHRGQVKPPTLLPVSGMETLASHELHEGVRVTVTADEVLNKWLAASGGADALKKVSSRVETGTITVGDTKSPIEVLIKAPDKRMSIVKAPDGQSITAFDGHTGWLGSVGRAAHEMSPEEDFAAMLDAAIAFPLTLKDKFARIRMWKPERLNGREVNVVLGVSTSAQPEVLMYFDKETGLLSHITRFVETPIGRIPTEIDYGDYREENAVRIPHRWTVARPQGRFTIQIERVRENVPIDDARFTKPEGLVPANKADLR